MTTDPSDGANLPEPPPEVTEGRSETTVTDPDGSVVRLIQDKEVIRNG